MGQRVQAVATQLHRNSDQIVTDFALYESYSACLLVSRQSSLHSIIYTAEVGREKGKKGQSISLSISSLERCFISFYITK